MRSEDLSGELQGTSERGLNRQKQKMTLKRSMTFWSLERRLPLSSSRRTSRSALRAEKRNIPNSTEIHRRDQNDAHKFGRVARNTHGRLLACRRESQFVRFIDRIHEVHVIKTKKPLKRYMWSGRRHRKIQATTSPDYVWPENWSRMSKAAQRKEKQECGY